MPKVFAQTRGDFISSPNPTFIEAILNPKADFGGLFALQNLPSLPPLQKLLPLSYEELSQKIFALLNLSFDPQVLQCYKTFDDPKDPAPISHLYDQFYLQELYHGPSRAFKDMALQPLGKVFATTSKEQKYLILTATSGDTGPATLESFKNLENIFVICLYPAKGTSDVQRLQMSTQDAPNLLVLPIIGNFDDTQSILKSLLNDEEFNASLQKKHIQLSAANSINFGRIAFQIIYHIWGYLNLVRQNFIACGEKIYSIIPSGNFGNALGAFYAKMMNLPIHKICIASNPNNILTDFITSGNYDISNRTLLQTHSPAMDILKSSNVERVLYTLFGANRTKELMTSLDSQQSYHLTTEELSILQEYFCAYSCSDEECLQTIRQIAKLGKIIDPHTANACFISKYFKDLPTLICSTAEWSKFSPTIAYALTNQHLSDKEALDFISQTYHLPIHSNIKDLFNKQEKVGAPLLPQEVKNKILEWLK